MMREDEGVIRDNDIKIRVIGLGGGGNNAVSRMIKDGVKNVDFYMLNTETGILKRAEGKANVLQIGKQTTRGLGAGADPVVGENSAVESKEEIRNIMKGSDIIFLTAGMGGGTGTGSIPIAAQIAREEKILTIAIVTKPFTFEGKRRMLKAESGIDRIKDTVDALIIISNDKLLKTVGDKTPLDEAFAMVDNILKQGIISITDLITTVGDVNVDFADVETILQYKGAAYMGIGTATGEERLRDATKQAIENPLTDVKIDGAKGVIFNVTGGETLGLNEINDAIKMVTEKVDPNANIIFGTVIDRTMDEEVKVTVIATGIGSNRSGEIEQSPRKNEDLFKEIESRRSFDKREESFGRRVEEKEQEAKDIFENESNKTKHEEEAPKKKFRFLQ